MAEEGQRAAWSAVERETVADERLLSAERQLALVDRIIGLEAQLAQLGASTPLAPSEQLRTEQELSRMRQSLTWRVGTSALRPARFARKVMHRLGR